MEDKYNLKKKLVCGTTVKRLYCILWNISDQFTILYTNLYYYYYYLLYVAVHCTGLRD